MVDFWIDFLANFFATILGLLFGVPIALWLDREIVKRHQKEEAKNVLSAFRDELDHNLKLIGQIKEQLGRDLIVNKLDLSTWEAIADKLSILGNYELIGGISRIHHEYKLLNREIDAEFQVRFTKVSEKYPGELRGIMNNTIRMHCNSLEKKTKDLIKGIGTELQKN